MALRIALPDFNGSVSAGLAAIGDHSLSRDEQLVLPGLTNAKENAIVAAAEAVRKLPAGVHADTKQFVGMAAFTVVAYGMVGPASGPGGKCGEYRIEACSDVTQEMVDEVVGWVGSAGVSNAATIILATKLGFWQTNHHTGAGAPNPHIVKVIGTVLPKVAMVEAVKYVDLAGHWADTHVCLNILGIHVGAPFVSSLRISAKYEIKVADDFKLHQDTMPAGTEKFALCDAVVKKFVTNRIWALLPPSDFAQLMNCCQAVSELRESAKEVVAANMTKGMAERTVDPRAAYHQRAFYLVKQAKRTFAVPECSGIIGSFLMNLQPRSKMTRSPYISIGQEKKYEASETYSDEWERICAANRRTKVAMSPELVAAVSGVSASGIITKDQYAAFTTMYGIQGDQSSATESTLK